jgi:hypothetical protein
MKNRRTLALVAGVLCLFSAGAGAQTDTNTTTPPAPAPHPAPPALSPVIWTENPDVVQRFAVNNDEVRSMLNRSLLKLTSASDIGTAWARLGITPQDVVGIKITTAGGPLLSTHRALVQAICDGLQEAGVPTAQIIVWDKDAGDMQAAGYPPMGATNAHVGIDSVFPGSGYDPSAIFKNEVVGTLIWGDSEFVRKGDDLGDAMRNAVKTKAYGDDTMSAGVGTPSGDDALTGGPTAPQTSDKSHFANLVSTICTKIINVPVLTDNANMGIEGCMGSLALASLDNNRRFIGDPSFGDPAICEILNNPLLRRKVVIHILDALVAQYAGGPRFDPQFTKSIGALYVSRDPVAVDSLVLRRIESWRASDRDGRIDPIGKNASYIHDGTNYNLGTDDPQRIQLIRLP